MRSRRFRTSISRSRQRRTLWSTSASIISVSKLEACLGAGRSRSWFDKTAITDVVGDTLTRELPDKFFVDRVRRLACLLLSISAKDQNCSRGIRCRRSSGMRRSIWLRGIVNLISAPSAAEVNDSRAIN